MTDLVERLRTAGTVRTQGYSIPREAETMQEAAAEIERLRARIARAAESTTDQVAARDLHDALCQQQEK